MLLKYFVIICYKCNESISEGSLTNVHIYIAKNKVTFSFHSRLCLWLDPSLFYVKRVWEITPHEFILT